MAIPPKYLPATQAALRIAAGAAFWTHGAQKLLGWFGGFGQAGTAPLMSRFGAAGVIEFTCGLLIMLGAGTRYAAFIASGEMAVAYFWMHMGSSGNLFWWQNRGETVMLFSFIFLVYSAWGAGPLSVDSALEKRRG